MRKQTSWLKLSLLLASLTVLAACGNANNNAPSVSPTGQTHPSGWIQLHGAVAAPAVSACTECHGEDLAGGIVRVSCTSTTIDGFRCHITSPADNPSGCVSCHNGDRGASTAPFGPNNTTPSVVAFPTAPNHQNAHDVHTVLTGVTCDTCHNGAGHGTALHANATTNVLLSPTFAAKTGTFSYNASAGTCVGVSCHGGQTTPSWSTGAIDVAADCLKCHQQGDAGNTAQTPQYNSFHSGIGPLPARSNLHFVHLHLSVPGTITPIFCTDCHSAAIVGDDKFHFSGLATPAFETDPADTIGGPGTRIITYTADPTGNCSSSCHITNADNPKNWIN